MEFWKDKPFLRELASGNAAVLIGGPLIEQLRLHYWNKLRALAGSDPHLRRSMPGMLVAPDKIAVYLGQEHLAIEYFGPEHVPDEIPEGTQVTFTDCRSEGDLIENIIGMRFEGSTMKLPLGPREPCYNLFLPTTLDTISLMLENGWDLSAETMTFGMNTGGLAPPHDEYTRVVNGFFYGVENGRLKTRRVQWIEFLPATITDIDEEREDLGVRFWPDLDAMAEEDAHLQFPRPVDFENQRLALLNRFRELILKPETTEPQITSWLAQPANQFILRMSLPAISIFDQRKCEWVTDQSRDPIIPDFFAVRANGYSDIVEFKLPELKGTAIVGKMNRETFSAEVSSYIAQTHFYREYFGDSQNRKHVKDVHGIEVFHPKRVLVMGRRWQFENAVWRSVATDFPDLTILTYDDLIDSVAAQLYQNPH